MRCVVKYISIVVVFVFIAVGLLISYYPKLLIEVRVFFTSIPWGWREWPKLIITTFIGGAIGGLITYSWISPFEKRKEKRAIKRELENNEREKKERCTKALLATQMPLLLQMSSIKGIQKLTDLILNFKLANKLLAEIFKNTQNISDQTNSLFSLMKEKRCGFQILTPLMQHIIFSYEIFEMLLITVSPKICINQLTAYFEKLKSLNLIYANINSKLAYHNETKKSVINSIMLKSNFNSGGMTDNELRQVLSAIPAIFELALTLREFINKYLKNAENIFRSTDRYIELLGISQPIPVNRDANGNIIFDPCP